MLVGIVVATTFVQPSRIGAIEEDRMVVNIAKLTDTDLMHKACESTMHGQKSNLSLSDIYKCEHSPIRTQLFWIEMIVPTFVSVHFVRHKIGVEHFVQTNREDRGGLSEVDRMTPVKHSMLINAQALIQMARKRLCKQSHSATREAMRDIKMTVFQVDPDLYEFLVPECMYRGKCPELKSCRE